MARFNWKVGQKYNSRGFGIATCINFDSGFVYFDYDHAKNVVMWEDGTNMRGAERPLDIMSEYVTFLQVGAKYTQLLPFKSSIITCVSIEEDAQHAKYVFRYDSDGSIWYTSNASDVVAYNPPIERWCVLTKANFVRVTYDLKEDADAYCKNRADVRVAHMKEVV